MILCILFPCNLQIACHGTGPRCTHIPCFHGVVVTNTIDFHQLNSDTYGQPGSVLF